MRALCKAVFLRRQPGARIDAQMSVISKRNYIFQQILQINGWDTGNVYSIFELNHQPRSIDTSKEAQQYLKKGHSSSSLINDKR